MAKFNIKTFVKHYTPPNYRLPKFITSFISFLSGLINKYDAFTGYQEGDNQPLWSNASTYISGAKVKYNFSTYESLTDDNTGNIPDSSTDSWVLRNPSFIGVRERALYDGKYLKLTYQLNRYFETTFRQPPYPAPYGGSGTFSDIYITNESPESVSFAVSEVTQSLGAVSGKSINIGLATVTILGIATSYKYIIHMPLSVFNSLGANNDIRDSVVRRFVDIYNPSGITYTIITY